MYNPLKNVKRVIHQTYHKEWNNKGNFLMTDARRKPVFILSIGTALIKSVFINITI